MVPSETCGNCRSTVPAGVFCGNCGAGLRERGHPWMRAPVYAALPRESIVEPAITSTLFPHLARQARNPFRHGLALLFTALIAGSMLRLTGPLVTIAALGIPLLFVLYVWQSGVYRDIGVGTLLMTAAVGVVAGVAWPLLTGGLVARYYGISLAAGFVLEHVLTLGLVVALGASVLMVLPAVVVRLARPGPRESMEGFVIGALGALCYTGAATVTRLAPQYVAGFIDTFPRSRLLVESALYGVALPLTAAATGAMIGIVLWFRPSDRVREHPVLMRAVLLAFTVLVGAIYLTLWVIDASRLTKVSQLALHIVMTALALLALRIGVQLALLHESTDPATGAPLLCSRCERVVPDMPFCPACGVAARAAPRASRTLRRESPPERIPSDHPQPSS